jgi:hypothetical protein
MESDINMVFSDKSSKMATKLKFLIIGLKTETLGKFKELTFNTKFISTEKLERPLTIKAMRGLIGRRHRPS